MHFFDVTLVGFNQLNAHRALLTLALLAITLAVRYCLHYLMRLLHGFSWAERFRFWSHQAINVVTAVFFIVVLISIWVGPHTQNLGTIGGLIGAGIAFALQRFIIAIAGYVVILRGKTFSIGDRVAIGEVRGEVIALDFFQTTVLEMGQPPSVEEQSSPSTWVLARQYTGRIVLLTNGVIFEKPVYNYSRDFPFIWEELDIGVHYDADLELAERILLEAARRHSSPIADVTRGARAHLKRVYDLEPPDVEPRVYYRITSNWVELALRFVVGDRNIRDVKSAMWREILQRFREEEISVASSSSEVAITQLPPKPDAEAP